MPFGIRFGTKTSRPAFHPGDPTPVALLSHQGFKNKIALIKAIREHSGSGLAEAKHLCDRFLAGHQVTFDCLSEDAALHFIDAAAQLGVTAQHADTLG